VQQCSPFATVLAWVTPSPEVTYCFIGATTLRAVILTSSCI